MSNLSTEERLLINSEIGRKGKNMIVAYILAIFLGSLGAHRFYLGKIGSGVIQLLLFIFGWVTAIILVGYLFLAVLYLWVLVDLFLIPGIIKADHRRIELEMTAELKQNHRA